MIIVEKAVSSYLKDIKASRPLSATEEIELARRIKLGDKAAVEKLITANTLFVVSVARQYRGRGLSLAELISAGNEGLVTAAHRFNESEGAKFVTYAVWWIRQGILNALAEETRTVRLPVNKVKAVMKLLKATKIKSSQLGRIPDSRELAEEIGWLPDEVDDIRSIAPYDCSLDTPFPSGDKTILDALPDRGSVAPDDEIIEKETREKLDEALEVLDSRSRDVVELWFGFRHLNVPKSPKQMRERNTLDQIGQHFGLTRERVRQIKAQALPELKKALLKRGISSSRPSA